MMKTIVLMISMLLSLYGAAQTKKETFKVYGNCGQCKDRIETAVLALKGVIAADWDMEALLLTVEIDTQQVSLDDVHAKVLAEGHDTDKMKATDKAYRKLPLCCKYERENISEATKSGDRTLRLRIAGMTCEDGCAKGIENVVYKQKGVKFSEVNYAEGMAHFIYDPVKITKEEIIRIIVSFNPEGESSRYRVEEIQ